MGIAAVGQICSSNSMAHNLEQCVRLVAKAAAAGAQVLFLPEASDYIAASSAESVSLAKPIATSPFVTGLQSAALKHALDIHVGVHVPVSSKLYNSTIWIDSKGNVVGSATYNKLHLFDYSTLRESASVQSGSSFTPPVHSPVGRVGSLICFDLRFPEAALHLTRPPSSSSFAMSPAQILLYPSAFTVPTGRAHWEVLLRARAIETQSWVIAAAQVGRHNGPGTKRVSYGKSMVVDPWGKVAMELKGIQGNEEQQWEAEEGAVGDLGIVDVDLREWDRIREQMPLIRRNDVYPEI